MDILPLREGRDEQRVGREVGHDAELDLGIVARDQPVTRRGDEGPADAAALLGPDRDVLEVRVRGGQAPGGRHGLVIARVHAPGAGIDLLRELLGVGRSELGETAILQDQARQGIVERQLLQHRFGRGRLALGGTLGRRQTEPLEQDLLDLLRGIQVEDHPRRFVGLLFDVTQAPGELPALLAQHPRVDADAVALDTRQDRDERHLDVLVQLREPRLGAKPRPECLVELQGHIGVLGGIGPGPF